MPPLSISEVQRNFELNYRQKDLRVDREMQQFYAFI